jgi:hypothetical protein
MPYAEFQPSNAGSQFQSDVLSTVGGFQNIFARAQAIKQAKESFDMEKEQFATNQALAQVNLQQQSNALKQSNLDLELHEKAQKVASAQIDQQATLQGVQIDNTKANGELLIQLPAELDALRQIPQTDHYTFMSKLAGVQAKYGHLAQDPVYGPTFNRLVAPISGYAAERTNAFTVTTHAAANRANAALTPLLASTDDIGPKLNEILNSDYGQLAMLDPTFRDGPLKQVMENATKQSAQRNEAAKTAQELQLKQYEIMKQFGDRMVPGFGVAYPGEEKGLREAAASFKSSNQKIDQLIGMIGKTPSLLSPAARSAAQAEAATLVGQLSGDLRTALVGGRLTDTEQALISSIVRDPTHFWSFDSATKAALLNLKANLKQQFENGVREKIQIPSASFGAGAGGFTVPSTDDIITKARNFGK